MQHEGAVARQQLHSAKGPPYVQLMGARYAAVDKCHVRGHVDINQCSCDLCHRDCHDAAYTHARIPSAMQCSCWRKVMVFNTRYDQVLAAGGNPCP